MAIIMVIMARRQPYALAFASEVTRHLRAIDAKHHALIREKIGEQLRFEGFAPDCHRARPRPCQVVPACRPPSPLKR